MIFNPTVSEFNLNHEQPQPRIPHLARSRNRLQRTQKIYHPPNYVNLRPQEFIIDVSLSKPPPTAPECQIVQEKQVGIRKHIDACLNAIESAYHQKKSRQSHLKTEHQPIINDRTIHRIDANLVLEYIRTICKDYKLRDRFGNDQPQILMPISQQRQSYYVHSPSSHRQRAQSLGTDSKNRKQYLNLTQTSKLDRRGSSSHKKKVDQPTSPRTHQQTHSMNASPQLVANQIRFANGSQLRNQTDAKIEEDFRYCINCQASILSKNVDFHEKHQCKNFAGLYKLSFGELTTLVGEKVLKMNKQLKQKLEWLKEKDLSKSRYESICNQTLQKIEQYAKENSLSVSLDKSNAEYLKVRDSLNNEYIQVVKLTHKLHWFNQIHANLKAQCGRRREGSRVGDLSMFVPRAQPVVQQKPVVPPSPIAQLYPHLHRRAPNAPRPMNTPP